MTGTEYIGYAGTGSFSQDSGTNMVTLCDLGKSSGGVGSYVLSAGLLSVSGYEYVGGGGTGSFTQSGGTHSLAGYLSLANAPNSSGSYALSDSGTLTAANVYIGGSPTASGGSATFSISGGSATVTGAVQLWNSSSQLDVSGGSLNAGTLNMVAGTLDQTGGTIGGACGITVAGGSATLGGINNYTGGTIINGGTVAVNNAASLGVSTGGLTINAGTLEVTATFADSRAITLGNTSAAISVDSGATYTNSGVLSGTGALNATGAGTLALSGINNYTGGTIINGGTVAVNNAASLGVSTGGLTINAGTLEVTATFADSRAVTLGDTSSAISVDSGAIYTTSGVLSGTGALNATGAGTLALSGINNYTGGTTVSGGSLLIAHVAALGSGGLTIDAGSAQIQNGLTSPAAPFVLPSLTLAGGSLDVTNNSLVIRSVTDISSTIRDAVISGRLTTTVLTAPATPGATTGLGYLTGSSYTALTGLTTFGTATVNPNDIVVRWTYAGDINLDGVVDINDFRLMDAGYLMGFSGLSGHVAEWINGDVTGSTPGSPPDGIVDYHDFAAAAAALGGTSLGEEMSGLYAEEFGTRFWRPMTPTWVWW